MHDLRRLGEGRGLHDFALYRRLLEDQDHVLFIGVELISLRLFGEEVVSLHLLCDGIL